MQMCGLQDDASLDLAAFRQRFGDTPQKGELTLLCPLKEDPTEKVGWSPSAPDDAIDIAGFAWRWLVKQQSNSSGPVIDLSQPKQLGCVSAGSMCACAFGWLLVSQ